MKIDKKMKWLCEHSYQLEKYSGQWVLCQLKDGVIAKGKNLDIVLKNAKRLKATKSAFVLHVPKKDELVISAS